MSYPLSSNNLSMGLFDTVKFKCRRCCLVHSAVSRSDHFHTADAKHSCKRSKLNYKCRHMMSLTANIFEHEKIYQSPDLGDLIAGYGPAYGHGFC